MTQKKEIEEIEVLALICKALDQGELKYSLAEDGAYIFLAFQGKELTYDVALFWGPTYISIHVMYPFAVAENAIPNILKKLNELSVRQPVGGFEIHPDLRINLKIGLRIPPLMLPSSFVETIAFAVLAAEEAAGEISALL